MSFDSSESSVGVKTASDEMLTMAMSIPVPTLVNDEW